MEFVDFCCNDIVSKSQIDFLVRLNHQPRKGLLPFRHTIIIITTPGLLKGNEMKKALILLSVSFALLVVVFALSSCGVLLNQAGLYEGFEYVVDSEYEITLTGYKGENTRIEIPAWIDGYKVVAIDFDENDPTLANIESIKIPKTIVSLTPYTFAPCVNLKEITVALDNPEYKYLHGALYSKDGKTLVYYPQAREDEELVLGKRITKIGENAFRDARYLKRVTLEGVEEISSTAFVGCSALESVDFGTKLKKIGDSAFEGCSLLTEINIPNSAEHVGVYAFRGCTGVSSISLGSGMRYVGYEAFENLDNVSGITEFGGANYLGNSENPYVLLVKLINKAQKSCHVHSSANVIYASAFEGCAALETVEIPHHLTCIGRRAFYGCKSLKAIALPEGMDVVDEYAFYGCSSIVELEIPSSVTKIESYAFSDCKALESLTLSDRTRTIARMAFFGCSALTDVTLPDTVSYIGDLAFSGCSSLLYLRFTAAEGWIIGGVPTDLSDPEAAAVIMQTQVSALTKAAPEL